MGTIIYDSNNSGGSWWLTDDDWRALENAGWIVHWVHDPNDPSHEHQRDEHSRWPSSPFGHTHHYDDVHRLTAVTPSGERWLGALASSAAKTTDDPAAAVAEFEQVTGQDASAVGCNCCGSPHSFEYVDNAGKRSYASAEVAATRLSWS